MNHLSETALEHYLLGGDDLDAATVEQHILECDDCAAHVRSQIELEMQLAEVARNATFCPGCSRVLAGDRCDACGATLVAGGYRIERVLVKTTHGRLYVAVDGGGKRVALKELAFVQAPTLESLAAFDRETKFLRALSHPAIPRFHASFIEGTGIHTRMYIAQDLVEGESLLARLTTHWFEEKEIVDIAKRVLEILIYLQSLSPMVFHRDIKPANLIVRADGSIALVDFGAARDVSETMGNTAVGTFGYMPMEQMAGVYDATTDLYALGASLLHLLTRREPWKLLDGSASPGVNVSPGLRTFLDKLCARRPQDRFSDAVVALAALGNLKPGAPIKKPKLSRNALIAISTVGLCVAGIGAGVAVALMTGDDRPAWSDETPTTTPIKPMVAPEPPPTSKPVQPDKRVEVQVEPNPMPVEELLGPGRVSRISRQADVHLPDDIEHRVRQLSPRAQSDLRAQVAGAFKQRDDHPRGRIAIGRIIVPSADLMEPGELDSWSLRNATTYYYATTVTGPFDVALHGYARTTIDPKFGSSDMQWLPDLVLQPLYANRTVTVVGTADVSTTIRASILHAARDTPAGRVEGAPASQAVETTVRGEFSISGFSPGRYRITLTSSLSTTIEEYDVDLAGERFDLDRARKRRPPPADNSADLMVTSKPPARVLLDGIVIGNTPIRIKATAGRHKLTFVVGTSKWSFPVTIKAGETLRMHKDLE